MFGLPLATCCLVFVFVFLPTETEMGLSTVLLKLEIASDLLWDLGKGYDSIGLGVA